ncbi:MAG: hypothetical protein AB8G99_00095, partial [Planctomycetaceae bacterium]
MVPIPASQRRAWKTKTNAGGTFALRQVPKAGVLSIKVAAEGFGDPQVTFTLDRPLQLVLRRGSPVNGRLAWPDGAKRPVGGGQLGTVSIQKYDRFSEDGKPTASLKQAAYVCLYSQKQSILADGSVTFPALPPGSYSLNVTFDLETPLGSLAQKPLLVSEVEPTSFEINAARAYRLSGRAVSSVDGKPVANATVQVWTIRNGRRRYGPGATTGSDGTFSCYTPKGETRVMISSASGFVGGPEHSGSPLYKERFPTIDVVGDTEWPEIKVDPSTDVVVQILDTKGNPVPNAQVRTVASAGAPANFYGARTTDENGKCVVSGADATDTLPIWARTEAAVSDGKTIVTPGELDGPVEIKVSPDNGVRFRCKVVDRDGKPIPDARVTFKTSFRFVSKWLGERGGLSLSGSAGFASTDKDGVAISGPLWAGQTYWITASAEGYDVSEAPQLVGQDGTTDIKPFVLKASRASEIAGTVVNTDGEPIADARVFAAGKKYRMPITKTAADGSFLLDEIAPDVRYVFVDAAGYRFGGVRVGSQSPVAVTLRPVESSPKGVRKLRPVTLEDRTNATRKLIDQMISVEQKPGYSALQALVWIDGDEALVMSDAAGGRFSHMVRNAYASRIAKEDSDKAVELLRGSKRGLTDAIAIGRRLAKSDDANQRNNAKKFANLAKQLIKKQAEPKRIYPLLVPLLTEVGDTAAAKRFIGELQSLSGNRAAAVALAPYDYEQATALCGEIKEGYVRTTVLADMIVATAHQDLNKALARLNALEGDSNTPNIRDKARARIAMMVVGENPDKAIEIVRACTEPDNRAQAIGWLCIPIAKHDKQKAWDLIEEALAIHRQEDDAYRSWSNFGGAGPPAARLAHQALQAGYPDMESVVWHVRAACRARSQQGMQRLDSTIKTAKVLALVDRIAARELLNLISHQKDQLGRREPEWLQAWVLTDFNRAVGLFSDRLEADQKKGKLSGNYQLELLMQTDPEEKFQMINSRYLALWDLNSDQ